MSHTDHDENAKVPGHFKVLLCALVFTTATLAVQVMYTIGGPAAGHAVAALRTTCTILWAWFFTAYAVHTIVRRADVLAERIAVRIDRRAEEPTTEEPAGRGLDTDAIQSAKVIAMRLMHDR